ncbi:hypothetical protein BOTNAR_0101g00260 [Botryotinia narcissicola]|uniref:Uncharacterized protein n=1 Tax=Botryotinia narcissicola TaxID=278944 RepID=A0A4Z1IUW9_9HELO|nr:hypothetical protein BOTNAR_0101g00260 [Botryotinia narcissicola]
MAISKQQEAFIAKIVSYNPATWFLACESEVLKIPDEDRAEFGKILLEAMEVYKSKVQNVIPILKRGPNLNPEVNMRAWAMMHARFLARLFVKHPTLCQRLCVKLSNETYNPGWKCHVRKFRDIEKHKNEIEEQVEAACRKSQLFFSTHSGYNFVITNHSNSNRDSESKVQSYPRFEVQSREAAAQSFLALSQSSSLLATRSVNNHSYESNSLSQLPPPQFAPLEANGSNEQTTTSNSKSHTGERHPKHVRFALALEKSAAAELESISRMNTNSFYHTAQGKAQKLQLERNLQAQIASQDDDLYGVSDDERDRPTNTTKFSKKATTSNRGPGIEDYLENENPSPAETVDGDINERFSLREMIDAMEFVAEHPWICEHLLVDHVWDEYKLFQEYNTEALKVAEEEIEELNGAAADEATTFLQKGKEVGLSTTSVHRTRSTCQTSYLPSVPPSRLVSPPRSTLSVNQAGSTDEANANNMTAAEEEQAITAAAKAGFVNRNFQLQVATVYRVLGVVPTATGPVTSNHPPINRVQSSESSAPANNAAPPRNKSYDRCTSDHNCPTRHSQSSTGRYKTTNPVVNGDTIIVDTSSLVPAHVYIVPDHIAPPRHGRSSEELVSAYAAPKRRSQSTVGQASVDHSTNTSPSTSSDRSKKSLAPTMNRAQMREQLQIAAVYQSLGRQNERPSENFGNDGARVEMNEEVGEVFDAAETIIPGRLRRGRDVDLYNKPHDRRMPSFAVQENVPETFTPDRFLNMHGGAGAPGDFGFNPLAKQNMHFGPSLATQRRTAISTGQDQRSFAADRTQNEQEVGFARVEFSGTGNRSLNHRIPEMYGPSQRITALDNPREDFWINRGSYGDFEPTGMGLNMDFNMDLNADFVPNPHLNDIYGSNNFANFRGNYNFDFNVENMPFSGPRRSSRQFGTFIPDADSSGFGGMKPFGTVNENIDGVDQTPVGFEGMDEFMFHNTPLARIDAGFGFDDMNQTFDQCGRMDPVDVPEIPCQDNSGIKSQPGETVAPVTPDSTRASTRSQRRSPAKGSAKGTPRKLRKTPVKKGPKVAFNPRPASAPSTLDRGPPRRYHQTRIDLSPGALGPQFNLEISGRQRRLPFTTVAQDRAEFKKEFEMDSDDQDL